MTKTKLEITEHNGLKVGDLIITNLPIGQNLGYYRLAGFHTDAMNPNEVQVDYYQVLNGDGSPSPRRKNCCHNSYCIPITREWIAEKRTTWHNEVDTKINNIYDALEISPAELQTTPKLRIRKSHKKINR